MQTFLFKSPNLLVFGAGSLDQVVPQVRRLGANRPLVVTDGGVVRAGLLEQLQVRLSGAGVEAVVYDGVLPDPGVRNVAAAVETGRQAGCDLVIGFGGGSAMDVAKAAAVVLRLGGSIRDYFGGEQVPSRGLPTLMIPTTAGTGSEVSTAVVLLDEEAGFKRVANATNLLADVAIVDPVLTLTVPPKVTADSGMDALVHAIEAYTSSTGASPVSDAIALEAIRLAGAHLRPAFANGRNLEARTAMAYAATLGGLAFTAAGLGGVHAMAYPLSERYHLSHGRSNAVLLPHVLAYNLPANPGKYARIAAALGERIEDLGVMEAAARAVAAAEALLRDLEIPARLRDYGIEEALLDELADEAFRNGARLLPNNARQMDQEGARRIYRSAW